jgi:hypothetical protein
MPLGRVLTDSGQVLGLSRGGVTGQELHELIRLQATAAIQRWEELTAKESSSPEERKAAKLAAFWALFPLGRKSFEVNGKRYKRISNRKGIDIRVTPAPEKKQKK